MGEKLLKKNKVNWVVDGDVDNGFVMLVVQTRSMLNCFGVVNVCLLKPRLDFCHCLYVHLHKAAYLPYTPLPLDTPHSLWWTSDHIGRCRMAMDVTGKAYNAVVWWYIVDSTIECRHSTKPNQRWSWVVFWFHPKCYIKLTLSDWFIISIPLSYIPRGSFLYTDPDCFRS